jgi:hypothetical protein
LERHEEKSFPRPSHDLNLEPTGGFEPPTC